MPKAKPYTVKSWLQNHQDADFFSCAKVTTIGFPMLISISTILDPQNADFLFVCQSHNYWMSHVYLSI